MNSFGLPSIAPTVSPATVRLNVVTPYATKGPAPEAVPAAPAPEKPTVNNFSTPARDILNDILLPKDAPKKEVTVKIVPKKAPAKPAKPAAKAAKPTGKKPVSKPSSKAKPAAKKSTAKAKAKKK